ncbi:MAG: tetratricopeptide repeat protein [Bacteroidota bacterium]
MKKILIILLLPISLYGQVQRDTILAKQYEEKAKALHDRQKYDSSNVYHLKAKALYEKHNLWSKALRREGEVINNIWYQFRLDEASERADKLLEDVRSKLGQSHFMEGFTYYIIGNIQIYRNDLINSLDSYRKALSIYKALDDPDYTQIANVIYNIGAVFDYLGEYDSGLVYSEKALEADLKIYGAGHPRVAENYQNIGNKYFGRGHFEKSLYYFERSIEILEREKDVNRNLLFDVIISKAAVLVELREYDRAMEYLSRVLRLADDMYNQENPHYSIIYMNMAKVFGDKNLTDSALYYYKKSINIIERFDVDLSQALANAFSNISYNLKKEKRYDEALKYIKRSIEIQESYANVDHPKLGKYHLNLAVLYYDQSLYEKAQAALQIAMDKFKRSGDKNAHLGECYNILGRINLEKRQYDLALANLQKAIVHNTLDFQNLSIFDNPAIDDYLSKVFILRSLHYKAYTLNKIFEREENDKYLLESLKVYQLYDSMMDQTPFSALSHEDRIFLRGDAKDVYEQGISTNLTAYNILGNDHYLKKAFQYMEKSKNGRMQNALSLRRAKEFGGLPDSVLVMEAEINQDIKFYEEALNNERIKRAGLSKILRF